MDQREIATFLKCSYSAVTKWESGNNPIPPWVEEKLADNTGKFVLSGLSPEEIAILERKAASKGVSPDEYVAQMVRAALVYA